MTDAEIALPVDLRSKKKGNEFIDRNAQPVKLPLRTPILGQNNNNGDDGVTWI